MSSKKKSAELIPKIVGATTQKEAVETLQAILEALHLKNTYVDLMGLKDTLGELEMQFKDMRKEYRELPVPKTYSSVQDIRTKLSLLYTDIVDTLDFDVNRLKVYYEEKKTQIRAESMISLKEDEAFQGKIKASSPSSLRDIVGADESYKEYIVLASISYGLWSNLKSLLSGIKLLTDSLSSETRNLYNIENKTKIA